MWDKSDSFVAQTVKNPPAMQVIKVWSLSWQDSSEEGNDNSGQYSFLENSMGGEAWQGQVHGVVKSQTPLSK